MSLIVNLRVGEIQQMVSLESTHIRAKTIYKVPELLHTCRNARAAALLEHERWLHVRYGEAVITSCTMSQLNDIVDFLGAGLTSETIVCKN